MPFCGTVLGVSEPDPPDASEPAQPPRKVRGNPAKLRPGEPFTAEQAAKGGAHGALRTVESVRKMLSIELSDYRKNTLPTKDQTDRIRAITGAARALAAIIDLNVTADLAAIKRLMGLPRGRVPDGAAAKGAH